ncbi:MAG: 3-hydroxyisobutyrate dehydrogenase [Hyphomicrobiales bacterium]|nr:3-hydroxyisobutyrate dehydrogenase [Hyphomicrobiales bacterium]MDE2016734.1 3-hydroxyisobutyrate dehydrogenase [Hyphomicrobiales bacterium]
MKIGFVGLGNMGGPMAANLVKAGHAVAGHDVVPAALEVARAAGVSTVTDAAAAAAGADLVFTMLPAGEHVRAVHAAIAPAMRAGATLVDCSTIDVASARAVHALAAGRGLASLDAPVSGGVAGASGATLTFMCGGADAAFAAARPALEAMGKRIVHCGGPGAGQAAKVCNNMMLAAHMIVTCEAFALADKLGLSAQSLFDVSSAASGQSWSLTSYCPAPGPVPASPANRGYKPGFAAALMLKDLRLALAAASETGAKIPIGAKAAELYESFVAEGGGGIDFSGIIKAVSR